MDTLWGGENNYEGRSSVKMAESVIQLPFIEQLFNSFANFSDVFLDCS